MAPEPARKRVVLCADDYAVHEAASRGIRRLAEAGRLGATSAMVLSPRWPADARQLAPLRGVIDVGLHLDFTSEFARAAGLFGQHRDAAAPRGKIRGDVIGHQSCLGGLR